jgi:hypothetical protein
VWSFLVTGRHTLAPARHRGIIAGTKSLQGTLCTVDQELQATVDP